VGYQVTFFSTHGITHLLNLLIAGTMWLLPIRRRNFWDLGGRFKWANEWYDIDIGKIVRDDLSPQPEQKLEQIASDSYYGIGLDGRGMRVPSDLDDSLFRYQHLSSSLNIKLDRAAYWMSMASRQWTDSMSASFASVVFAAEALAGDGSKLNVEKKFHDFFETYAPDPGLRTQREDMYDMRSRIVHGSELMRLDQVIPFLVLDPPFEKQLNLNRELWRLMQTAARNWLKQQAIDV
jgi:hypothetical protein